MTTHHASNMAASVAFAALAVITSGVVLHSTDRLPTLEVGDPQVTAASHTPSPSAEPTGPSPTTPAATPTTPVSTATATPLPEPARTAELDADRSGLLPDVLVPEALSALRELTAGLPEASAADPTPVDAGSAGEEVPGGEGTLPPTMPADPGAPASPTTAPSPIDPTLVVPDPVPTPPSPPAPASPTAPTTSPTTSPSPAPTSPTPAPVPAPTSSPSASHSSPAAGSPGEPVDQSTGPRTTATESPGNGTGTVQP